MKRTLSFIAILLILLTACSPAAEPVLSDEPGQEAAAEKSAEKSAARTAAAGALVREAYPNYTASFVVDFDGASKWKYQLQVRRSPALTETSLHIEGVPASLNPGDIRLVTDGVTSWMTGPGTDNECVQYPNGTGMDPSLIYPETLIPLGDLPGLTKLVREEPFAGKTSQYYTGSAAAVGGWKDVRLEYRQEKGSSALLQFAMLATGDDSAFGGGTGTMMATYAVESLTPPVIAPVTGCEISVPLPASAVKYIRLPGLSSFDSPQDAAQMAAFYQSELPAGGWSERDAPAQSGAVTILSYQRGAEMVEIHIEAADAGGSQVTLLFLQ